MNLSEQTRSIRKQQQTDRLAAKATAVADGDYEAYSNFYSGQSLQVAKAEHNAKITQGRQLVRSTRDAIELSKVTGIGIPAALSAHNTAMVATAALIQEKQALFGKAPSFGLSGGDA